MADREGAAADAAVKYLAVGLGIGLLAGLAAGLLLAPKPGAEMRAEVSDAIKSGAEKLKEKAAEAGSVIKEKIRAGKLKGDIDEEAEECA